MNKKTIPPKLEWVQEYCQTSGYAIDADHFFDHHEARGWYLGKVKMKDWQAAVRTWVRHDKRFNPTGNENKKEWYETSQGIIDMGKKYGLYESDFDQFYQFKSAVISVHKGKSQLKLVV